MNESYSVLGLSTRLKTWKRISHSANMIDAQSNTRNALAESVDKSRDILTRSIRREEAVLGAKEYPKSVLPKILVALAATCGNQLSTDPATEQQWRLLTTEDSDIDLSGSITAVEGEN